MKSLSIDSATPPRVKSLIRALENLYLSDVHTMLKLPQPDHGLSAGCSFAIAQVLAAAISGISVTLYDIYKPGVAGLRFKSLLKDFFPWSLEPGNAIKPEEGAEIIYSLIRNPLTHALGLDLEKKRKGQKIIVKRLGSAADRGLDDPTIAQLEDSSRRFKMSPTVTIRAARTEILVEALYWGIRRMVEELSRDRARMQRAETSLIQK